MGFGIVVQGSIPEAYSWRFQTAEEANAEAERLSEKHNIDVVVVRILGEWKRRSEYVHVP